MWLKIGAVIGVIVLLGGAGWYLYNQNIKKVEDTVVMQCNTVQLEEELKNAKSLLELERGKIVGLEDALKRTQTQLLSQQAFVSNIKSRTENVPDDKLGDRSKELMRVLNERSANAN